MYLTTKQHVKKKSDFSSREQLVKSSVPNSSSINKILIRYKKQLIAVIDELEKREIEPTRDEFKYRLEIKLGLREDTRHAGYYSMWDYFDLFIAILR
jgi:hypothetical protein